MSAIRQARLSADAIIDATFLTPPRVPKVVIKNAPKNSSIIAQIGRWW